MVDQEISQHRVAEGSADERCHHRVSQGRAPLSQTESAKESGHYPNNAATSHQLMAIFGWDTVKQAEKYTQVADRALVKVSLLKHDLFEDGTPAPRWHSGMRFF